MADIIEAERKRTAELAEKAKSLKQLLSTLEAQRQKQDTAKAEEQRQREAQEALLRQPKLAFPDARGKLPFPAQGAIVRRFGEADGLGRDSQGLMIATRAGAQGAPGSSTALIAASSVARPACTIASASSSTPFLMP